MNSRSRHGDSPLMFCLKANQVEKAKILLNGSKTDVHIKNNDGKYPETIARLVFYVFRGRNW